MAVSLSGCGTVAVKLGTDLAAATGLYQVATPYFAAGDNGLVAVCLAYEIKVAGARATAAPGAAKCMSATATYGETACASIAKGSKPSGDPAQTIFWLGQQGILAEQASHDCQ